MNLVKMPNDNFWINPDHVSCISQGLDPNKCTVFLKNGESFVVRESAQTVVSRLINEEN